MLLNEFISNKLEQIRKEKKIKIYTLCKKAAISYETYRSIRKKTVIDGQILFNTIYCIKGEI